MKYLNRITVALFCTVLFGLAIAFLFIPDLAFSERENRSLRTFPSFSADKLVSGTYSDQINDYYADQFPLRDGFVGIKGICELLLGKGENDGVLLGEDGRLAQHLFDAYSASGETLAGTDGFDPDHVTDAAQALNRAASNCSVPFHVLLPGRNIDVTASSFAYPTEFSLALRQCLEQEIDPSVSYIDAVSLLAQKHDAGEYVYYKTDHHWTTLGAYYAYTETLRAMGMEDEILPIKAFDRQTVSEAFYGTVWSSAGMDFIDPDTFELWYYGNENDFTVTADGKTLSGFYNTDYLAKKDKYSVFLDGTHDVVTVTKNTGEERPTLLLIKDSFANSMAPFLAQHFDLVILNFSSPRSDYTDINRCVETYGADCVLFVWNLENVITTNRMNRLK